tara:strand:+ start:1041 stop:1211 length:171 start_codon:yes stop_codon:yes gene_type:complete
MIETGDMVWIQPKNAKIPVHMRIHGTILKKLQGEWYRVLTQGKTKALPERILTKVE